MSEHNYSNQLLSDRDFSNRILIGVDFSNSICVNCNFSGSDLSFANFKNTNLYRANFSNAILYVTRFEDSDLTRSNFDNAFIYGAKFVGNVNITYCSFENLQLEDERRESAIVADKTNYREITAFEPTVKVYGSKQQPNDVTYKEIYGTKFFCNNAYMEFRKYKPYEREMQFSQIYNRLKRIYKENNFSSEAGDFYFLEKYWQTRSWFITGTKEDFAFSSVFFRVINTLFARLNELICGYGEKPLRVVGGMIFGTLAFTFSFYLGAFKEDTSFTNSSERFLGALYHSLCTILMIDSSLNPLGISKIFTILETIYGLMLITLLTAILIRKMIRD